MSAESLEGKIIIATRYREGYSTLFSSRWREMHFLRCPFQNGMVNAKVIQNQLLADADFRHERLIFVEFLARKAIHCRVWADLHRTIALYNESQSKEMAGKAVTHRYHFTRRTGRNHLYRTINGAAAPREPGGWKTE